MSMLHPCDTSHVSRVARLRDRASRIDTEPFRSVTASAAALMPYGHRHAHSGQGGTRAYAAALTVNPCLSPKQWQTIPPKTQ